MDMAGMKVTVLGLGERTAMPLIHFLLKQGCQLFLSENRATSPLLQSLDNTLDMELGRHTSAVYENKDLIITSPGVPVDIPVLQEAKRHGVPIWSEIELAYRFSRAPFVAITGTNGKTTVTTLLGRYFQALSGKTVVAGNIGTPVIGQVEGLESQDWIIAEVSSFQLELIHQFRPRIACILNIFPDHLNRHKTMERYIACKANIFARQGQGDTLLLNGDQPITLSLGANRDDLVKRYFSLKKEVPGCCVQGDRIVDTMEGETLFSLSEIRIPGEHNVANVLAAVCMARIAGVPLAHIRQITREFHGLPHTLEFVREHRGVRYINDSQGTNPQATISALQAINQGLILIAGGQDRGLDFQELARSIVARVRVLIVMGENKKRLKEDVLKQGLHNIYEVQDMGEAVCLARDLARTGETVLMSPASPSWDQYSSYVERGDCFRQLVMRWEEG